MRNMQKMKLAAAVVAVVLLIGGTLSGTLAWMLAKTSPVTNTFTTSELGIKLEENTGDQYQMIPGVAVAKDPYITVDKDSEDCILFVKIEEKGVTIPADEKNPEKTYKFNDFLKYGIAEGWTALTGTEGVYYRFIIGKSAKEGVKYPVLGEGKYEFNGIDYEWADNTIFTLPEVTEEMMDDLKKITDRPTLTFTAYACQYKKDANTNFTAEEAWKQLNPPTT